MRKKVLLCSCESGQPGIKYVATQSDILITEKNRPFRIGRQTMHTRIYKQTSLFLALLLLSGCSYLSANSLKKSSVDEANGRFLSSGTIILSQKVPDNPDGIAVARDELEEKATPVMAPLLGYFPPAASYLPAENETWLEIHRDTRKLLLFKGKSLIKEIDAEGMVSIKDGDYYLQHKQKQPLWYASDEYFNKRRLALPTTEDRLRYRRGALGQYALYPTMTFPIHCAPVWSDDVGGLRISSTDLSSIYYMLPVGAPIVVK